MSAIKNPYQGWSPNYNNTILRASGKRPYASRKPTSFKRPPAQYGNPSWEENVARVERLKVGKGKK